MDGRRFFGLLLLLLGTGIGVGFGLGPWLAVAGLALFLLVFALTGAGTYRALCSPGPPVVTEVALDDPDAPDGVREEWRAVGAELVAEGFRPLGAQRQEYHVGPAEEFSAAWGSPCGRFMVSSTLVSMAVRDTMELRRFLTAATWVRDGSGVETTAYADPNPIGPGGRVSIASFPRVSGAVPLAAVHRERLARLVPDLRAEDVVMPGDDVTGFARLAHDRLCGILEAGGYAVRQPGGGYRPTLRGWFRWTVANTWPITWVRRAVERRRGDTFLRSIGFPAPPPVRPPHVAAAVVGAAAIIAGMSLPGGLGASSWALIGMAAVWVPARRRGQPPSVPGVVLGGFLGATPLFALILAAPGAGAPVFAGAVVAFTLGAALLLWGWTGHTAEA